MEEKEVIINVEHLTKDYGYGRGVFDVSIKVHKGECYGYLGPNGAGKSTTIRHIMGFSKTSVGKVEIFGEETFGNTDKILEKVGYLPGADELGLESIAFPSISTGVFAYPVEEAADIVGQVLCNYKPKTLKYVYMCVIDMYLVDIYNQAFTKYMV